MKKIIFIFLAIIIFILGYVLGNIIPWSGFNFSNSNSNLEDNGIIGDAKLEINLVMDNNQPLGNIEVDLGKKAGPPEKGGVALTDENGIAVFNVQPGNYFIYFNSGNFPKNLEEPAPQSIQVVEGQVNNETVLIKVKKN